MLQPWLVPNAGAGHIRLFLLLLLVIVLTLLFFSFTAVLLHIVEHFLLVGCELRSDIPVVIEVWVNLLSQILGHLQKLIVVENFLLLLVYQSILEDFIVAGA